MAFVNHKTRELNAKIVYVGPAGSGKSANLRVVAERTDKEHVGNLIALERDGGRTAYFDFLPLFLGKIRGYRTRLHLYSVPGRIPFPSTRGMLLKGADAIVFVADSDPGRLHENLEYLKKIRGVMESLGADLEKIPFVFQLNKRDLPNAVGEEDLKNVLGTDGRPVFCAVAKNGEGVFDTLKAASRLILDAMLKKG